MMSDVDVNITLIILRRAKGVILKIISVSLMETYRGSFRDLSTYLISAGRFFASRRKINVFALLVTGRETVRYTYIAYANVPVHCISMSFLIVPSHSFAGRLTVFASLLLLPLPPLDVPLSTILRAPIIKTFPFEV